MMDWLKATAAAWPPIFSPKPQGVSDMTTFMRQSLVTVVDALRKEIGWIAANLVSMLAPILFEWWLELPRSEWDALNGIDA